MRPRILASSRRISCRKGDSSTKVSEVVAPPVLITRRAWASDASASARSRSTMASSPVSVTSCCEARTPFSRTSTGEILYFCLSRTAAPVSFARSACNWLICLVIQSVASCISASLASRWARMYRSVKALATSAALRGSSDSKVTRMT